MAKAKCEAKIWTKWHWSNAPSQAEVSVVLSNAGKSYPLEHIRKMCAKTEGANGDFRSSFGKHGQEMAIKIPRESIKAETLAVIDSC